MDTLSESISIFIRKIVPLQIIISERNHLHSEESAGRDYFPEVNSSLLRRICLQGLFFRDKFIPIQRNPLAGIIFSGRIHPYTKESASRDYFPEPNSSPLKRIHLQGLFSRAEFIPIQRNPSAGIIFPSRIHPHTKEFASRDALGIQKLSAKSPKAISGCMATGNRIRIVAIVADEITNKVPRTPVNSFSYVHAGQARFSFVICPL